MTFIPYGRQNISNEDIDSVIDVLKSDFLTQGPAVKRFEAAICNHCDSKYAVAANSATSALHLACLALGLGPGDIAWTSPITFVATANAIRYCQAEVDFVDISIKTGNICIKSLKEKLEDAKIHGTLPKIILPVHLGGNSCEMEDIYNLSLQYGFKIIEDASHAIGAKYKNEPVGNCLYSSICVFSFHPVKIITTAEGGVATTNDQKLFAIMKMLSSHGIEREQENFEFENDGPWYYEQQQLGYNYRMTEIQAALGTSQLNRLNLFVEIRNQLAERYNTLLSDLPIKILRPIEDSYSSYHLYIITLDDKYTKKSHRDIFQYLRKNNIGVSLNYIPVYKNPYYANSGFRNMKLENAEKYYTSAICLPLFVGLTEDMQHRVISVLTKALL